MQVISFYKFCPLTNLPDLRDQLQALCTNLMLRGTIILAEEGINGTIAGATDSIAAFLAHPHIPDLSYKSAVVVDYPFQKLKIKIKPEIISLGVPDLDVLTQGGKHIAPQDWNQLVTDPDIVLLDTRNHYEVAIGSFRRAIDPQLDSFREFPHFVQQKLNPQQHRKIAMFCTGGIRCEKASALLLKLGWQEVYQLDGGILQYLAEIPADQSLWQGECFVFDDRISVDGYLTEGSYYAKKGAILPKKLPKSP